MDYDETNQKPLSSNYDSRQDSETNGQAEIHRPRPCQNDYSNCETNFNSYSNSFA